MPERAAYPSAENETDGAPPPRFPVLWPAEYRAHALALSPGNALLRMGDPEPDDLAPDPEAFPDPVGEHRFRPVPFLVRKHRNRALVLATSRCFFYCRFCFRKGTPPGPEREPGEAHWIRIEEWLRTEPEVEEVILSGGDPLTLPDETLRSIVCRLSEIPSVRRLRVHTRAPVTYPDRVTEDLVQALGSRLPLRVVLHTNHPREVRPTVSDAVRRLQDGGIAVLNQAVLLSGVNDDVETLAELQESLTSLDVPPHYLHHPDRAPGAARFRLTLRRGRKIHEGLTRRLGPEAPPYVVDLPNGAGKCPVHALEAIAEETGPLGLRHRYRWARPTDWDSVASDTAWEWWDVWEGGQPGGP